jgi:Cu-Zn family superoxide dismutase
MKSIAFVLPLVSVIALAACTTDGGGGSGAASASSAAPASGPMPTAKATLLGGDGSPKGTATVVESGEGLTVTISALGLPPGTHAAHVHTTGVCTAPDFTSAGAHWNPAGKQHGKDNPAGMHMGDMPNMVFNASGTGELQFTIPGARLTEGVAPLLDADGAAIVIHAAADDMKTDPTGNAGSRLACGVLKLS